MLGAGQMRGVSALAPVLLTAKDFDELTDALLMAAKVSALLGVFFVDVNNTGSLPFDGEQVGSILQSGLEPGAAKVIPGGYDVKTLVPQQLQGTIDFAKLTLRQIAAGLGVPEHLLTGDLSQATYSSLRSSLASFKQRVERLQYHTIVPALLDPMWQRVITAAAIRGEIDLGEDIESALAVEWIAPPVLSPDPSKDADATQKLLDMGLTSRRRAAAELGWSVDELDAERAADAEREKALGLVTEKPAAPKTETISGGPTNGA
jgi:lambda family phage portal protein